MKIENPKLPQEHKENTSKFNIKSIGYAAHNLPLNENQLEVYPIEEYGYANGEITDEQEQIDVEGVDSKGNVYQDSIKTSNTILAEWLPWGSNRHAAPNVRRGERVLLWQYSDEDKYYWTSTGMDDHLRRKETAIFKYSNTDDETVDELNSTNSYSVIVSTHTKEFTLQTTKSDGEPFEYIIKLDAKQGIFVVTDDANNQISLESEKKRITIVNTNGSSISVDGDDININAKGNINLNAKGIVMKSTDNSVDATNYTINAKQVGITATKYGLKGGSMDLSGGNLIVGHDAIFNGKMLNNGVNVGSTHAHRGVKSGGDVSGHPQ